MMLGGAVTGALSMALGVTSKAPHGGVFVFFAIDNFWLWLLSIAAGTVVAAFAVVALKRFARRRPVETVSPACRVFPGDRDRLVSKRRSTHHPGGPMAERQATVASSSGLHARPAKLFVQAVQQTGVPVTIAVEGGPDLNAGSILTLMGLGATQGTVVTLKAEGDGADAALDSLVTFLETDHDAEADPKRHRRMPRPPARRVRAAASVVSHLVRAGIERHELAAVLLGRPGEPCAVHVQAHAGQRHVVRSEGAAGLHREHEVDRLADLQPRRADRCGEDPPRAAGTAYESPG
jgi:phosphocarrier protein